MKNFIFVIALIVLASLSGGAYAQEKAMTKADVEKMMHDYILENPQLILESVSNFQKKSMEERRSGAMTKHRDELQKDDGSPIAGNLNGDVTIIEFMDYNCHFCKDAFVTVDALIKADKNVRVVFKDYPILGPSSETAAKWALAAQKQKKYYEFHKALMQNKQPIDDDLLAKIAQDVGLDVEEAKKDAASGAVTMQIEKNRTLGGNIDVNGTPAFIIGDEVISGAMKLDAMQKKVSEQRGKKAGKK